MDRFSLILGYVWQKIDKKRVPNIQKGVSFPEAEKVQISSAYKTEEGSHILYGWDFKVLFKTESDQRKYPLDFKNINIKIIPKEFNENVMLMPDLNAYRLTNPSSLPGLDKKISVAGWKITTSKFKLFHNGSGISYGYKNMFCKTEKYDLFFSVLMRRNFIDPLIANVIPLFIMLFILFFLKTITTPDVDTIFKLVATCGAFFFTSIIAHVSLRSKLHVSEIIYFEYFYIVLYLTIMFTSVNAILYSKHEKMPLIKYHENFLPKLIYWPFVFGILYFISVLTFY